MTRPRAPSPLDTLRAEIEWQATRIAQLERELQATASEHLRILTLLESYEERRG